MKKFRILVCLLLCVAALALTGCGRKAPAFAELDFSAVDPAACVETQEVTDLVKITVKDYGDIIIRLYPDVAPKTVKNFQSLVSEGFYDGLTFHRVVENFVIQGGDPLANGKGDAGYKIKGEFTSNGFENNLKHIRGVLSMARGEGPNTASCQFFIMHTSEKGADLNGKYAAFGYVVSGMDVVDAVAAVPIGASDKPLTDVVMESVCFVKVSE